MASGRWQVSDLPLATCYLEKQASQRLAPPLATCQWAAVDDDRLTAVRQ
ncbi:MAG: hypothetical protein AB1791_14475 [Chloroflexota bacterium]